MFRRIVGENRVDDSLYARDDCRQNLLSVLDYEVDNACKDVSNKADNLRQHFGQPSGNVAPYLDKLLRYERPVGRYRLSDCREQGACRLLNLRPFLADCGRYVANQRRNLLRYALSCGKDG